MRGFSEFEPKIIRCMHTLNLTLYYLARTIRDNLVTKLPFATNGRIRQSNTAEQLVAGESSKSIIIPEERIKQGTAIKDTSTN
jgi:hypothetical protein